MRNILKKSTDPYIALLNYRTTPLLHGYSPAELMMSQKLRDCVPTILSQHIPFKPEVKEFKKKDEHQKSAEVLPWSSTPSKRSPTTSKRTTCVGEDSDNQRSSGDWKHFTLVCCYSDWQRYSTQKLQSTSLKKWEADISSNHNAKSVNTSEAEAGDSRWSKIWRACWRKGNHNNLWTSCGQETYHLTTCLLNRWKTAYTKSGRKVQAPQRLDVWKSCTLTCLLMWNFVWLLKFRSSCKIWISKTVLNPSRKTYFACS